MVAGVADGGTGAEGGGTGGTPGTPGATGGTGGLGIEGGKGGGGTGGVLIAVDNCHPWLWVPLILHNFYCFASGKVTYHKKNDEYDCGAGNALAGAGEQAG